VTKTPAHTPEEFQRFLSWLDEGVDSGGERYVEMRRRLASYFGRKRCQSPDDLADETLTRVARRLEEEGSITDSTPARYCYIVARFVFLEYIRGADRHRTALDEARGAAAQAIPVAPGIDRAEDERWLEQLDRCLQHLSVHDRGLILEYYAGDDQERIGRRRALAARLRLTLNALSIRACRIRDTLEACLNSKSTGA